MKVTLEHVRTFVEKQEFQLAPLTIVTGENSTGKSTLLGMISAMATAGFPTVPNFNAGSFQFGSYDTIATFKGGRSGRADSFSLGYTLDGGGPRPSAVEATYRNQDGRPVLSSLRVERKPDSLSVTVPSGKGEPTELTLRIGDKTRQFEGRPSGRECVQKSV